MSSSLLRMFGRRQLQVRVFSLVGLGVLLPLLLLAFAGAGSMPDLSREALADAAALSRLLAARVDDQLRARLEILQQAAAAPGMDLEDAVGERERAAVHEASLRLPGSDTVFVTDGTGRVAWHEPAGAPAPATEALPAVQEALHSGRPTLSPVVREGGRDRVYALVPVRSWRGSTLGVVGLATDPHTAFAASLRAVEVLSFAAVVDARGHLVAASDPSRAHVHEDGPALLARSAREHRPAAETCSGCGPGGEREVVALAPLASAPWAVSLCRQEGAAFQVARLFPQALARAGAAALLVALLFAWGAARSVRKPLEALTKSAQGIAAGGMDEPIPYLADDEVGRLGRSLERMRVALRDSLARVEEANADLERRVEERTRELERAARELQALNAEQKSLNRELRRRDEAHAQLLHKVIGAQEDERRRIARELHDETSQSLAAVAMRLETAAASLPEGEARAGLEAVKALSVRTLEEVHRLVLDLRPSVLDDLGLFSAIRWCADRHLAPAGIACRCEFDVDRRLPPQIETALFRVCQEAITNIARHARAESVLVQVDERDGRLLVEIEDDGRGFDPSAVALDEEHPSFGLMGMRERMELLGGTLEIDSSPGQGTHVKATVPLPAASGPSPTVAGATQG